MMIHIQNRLALVLDDPVFRKNLDRHLLEPFLIIHDLPLILRRKVHRQLTDQLNCKEKRVKGKTKTIHIKQIKMNRG